MKTAQAPSTPTRTASLGTASRGTRGAFAIAVLGGALVAGHFLAELSAPALHSKMLPWILSRGLGLAALLSLTGLTGLGLWLHHPWKASIRSLRPETWLRMHAALAATTVALVAAHLTALALDRYAHVGWVGALVPWHSTYRSTPVALGTLALWMMLLVGATAGLAGVVGGRHWLTVHRFAWLSFVAAWLHGITAGSDTSRLRLIYLLTGSFVLAIGVSRSWARHHQSEEAPA
jgi:hypothetical protein